MLTSVTTSAEGVQQRPNLEVCSTSTQQEVGDSILSRTTHSYLFSDFVMLDEPAKYRMIHYGDYSEEIRHLKSTITVKCMKPNGF